MIFFVAVVVVVVVVARRPNTSNGLDDGVARTGVGRGARTECNKKMASQRARCYEGVAKNKFVIVAPRE